MNKFINSMFASLLLLQTIGLATAFVAVTPLRAWTPPKAELTVLYCGFVAAIGDAATNCPLLTDPNVLSTTTARLEHRGPDGRQIALGHSGHGSTVWSMGHQRLAIVDPTSRSADMPFLLSLAGSAYKLVANGEIYNHEALYNELCTEHGWTEPRISHSDCEVIAHACACLGPVEAAKKLDGMFAFTLFTESPDGTMSVFCVRDPVGIKPLYTAKTKDGKAHVFASELKALTGHVDPATAQAIPAGHYWTPETGMVRYHTPAWMMDEHFEPAERPTDDEIRDAFRAAVSKRMMADVDYGFFLSGGIDSCVVAHALLPMYREVTGDDRPIPCFTVGMDDSPDLMAAKAMVQALGGSKHIDHRPRVFTGKDVFDLIPKIIYHMETYEAELIRSAIPNWLLAERAGADVKMVLTGEGSDELFAGYLYFMDAESPDQVQAELKRIYGMLGNINLHRTDRMTMAHGLEARVPFLDTKFTELVMSLDPAFKVVNREAVANNAEGREKTFLRKLFAVENGNGHTIPHDLLWRAKAMQCEGVGEDWVSQLQRRVSAKITDAELAAARIEYPLNTPQTKEELYYRRVFEDYYPGMAHVIHPWEGGCRAAGAAWKSSAYTREGLVNPNMLTHAFQKKSTVSATALRAMSLGSESPRFGRRSTELYMSTMSEVEVQIATDEFLRNALATGYNQFEACLTQGSDDRSLIMPATGKNKYHIQPRPIPANAIFRGSCTCNSPTRAGYAAAQKVYQFIKTCPSQSQAVEAIFQRQRSRIASCLALPEGTEVVLCPSGSDAEYIPVAIARALNPRANKVVNVVTQLREIGAGSSVAAGGEYFSTHTPLLGRLNEDSQERLEGFDNIVEVSVLAREDDGTVVDASAVAGEVARKAESEGFYPIVHGVFGGKTGLRDDIMPPSRDGGRSSMGVVDACQGRFSLAELHSWLEQDSIVLFTGSKFYQAPPFCGAVLIPKRIAEQLRYVPPPLPLKMFGNAGLGGFLTDKELPECMESWKPWLRRAQSADNIGLALRWEAGLAGMEAIADTPDDQRTAAIEQWAASVYEMVQDQPQLDTYCVERSIVSIRLRRSDTNGWRNMKELRDVYRYMSIDLSDSAPLESSDYEKAVLGVCCNLGQPVDVATSFAIVRIALGSESLASYLQNPTRTLKEDSIAVAKLAIVAKYFDTLQELSV
jgi:asparagine synthase (glutamine-hydrolysing)